MYAGPEDMIYMTITDGETAWEGHIDYAKTTSIASGLEAKMIHGLETQISYKVGHRRYPRPHQNSNTQILCHIEEINGPLMFLIKQVGAESWKKHIISHATLNYLLVKQKQQKTSKNGPMI